MKNTKKLLLMTSLIASTLVVTACGTEDNKETVKPTDNPSQGVAIGEYNPSTPENSKKEEPVSSDVKTMEKETVEKVEVGHTGTSSTVEGSKTTTPSKVATKEELQEISLFDMKEEKNYQADFHSGWKKAPTSTQEATIDGKGEEALEEGFAVLVVKNTKTNVSKIFTVKDGEQKQITPKYVEWIDDNRLYVIIGFPYGTITKGGELYELNLTNNKVTPVIHSLKENEEVVSIKSNKNGTFTYKKHIYDDENLTTGHYVEGTLPISPTK